jgi:UDP-GlcNAc:undecaprenyl-phosphate GlcNAc-1-phosphate transferase
VSFPPLLYLLAAGGAFAVAALTAPLWRRWCLRVGLVDDPGNRKIHHEPVPLAGGLTVMTALIIPTLVAATAVLLQNAQPHPATGPASSLSAGHDASVVLPPDTPAAGLLLHGLHRRGLQLGAILFGAFGALLLGVLDDRHELGPGAKFAGQFALALLVTAAGVRITLFVHNPVFSYAISILWMLTVINAFNFMDNMNGLCPGLGIIGSFYFALIAALAGQYLVALVAFLACGALLGFLPYNFPRARAFLGDAGSHLVGYLLAVLAILPHFYTAKNPRVLAVLSPLLILGVPLADLVRVVLIRWRHGQAFYLGDTNHLSHRLVRAGLSPAQAVVLIWLLTAALGGLALLLA